MSIMLDAYALIAFLRGQPGSDEVGSIIEDDGALLTSIDAAAVPERMASVYGHTASEVSADLVGLGIEVVEVDDALMSAARQLRAKHYNASTCAITLAECVAVACALERSVPLATTDRTLAALVQDEGGDLVPLADPAGLRPRKKGRPGG